VVFLILCLIISLALNVLFFWYIRKILGELLFVSNNIGDLLQKLDEFSIHLQNVHQMEIYYGEPTIQSLIEHSKEVVGEIENYKNIYGLTMEVIEGDEEDIEDGP
tara:strand:- start:442 stop:756 length:315 start_codon:yes stop_codon:yes gene_type:complete